MLIISNSGMIEEQQVCEKEEMGTKRYVLPEAVLLSMDLLQIIVN